VNACNSHSSGMYMRHADKLEAFFDEKLQEWQQLFSTYKEFDAIHATVSKKTNRTREDFEPEPYVPSFMKISSPQKFDIKEKQKKCYVCQKQGTETNITYKCSKCKRGYHANCYVPALK